MAFALILVLMVLHETQAKHLGMPFSILHGLKPAMPVENQLDSLFYPVTKRRLFDNIQNTTNKSSNTYFGDFIQVTYHPDERDLIKGFFSIWQFEDETRDAAAFTYQTKLTGEPQNTKGFKDSYATLLGISPQNMVGKAYVLARYWKSISTTTMSTADFSNLTSEAVSSNPTSDQVTELFSEYGTHYVSGFEMGDMIYQVFVYDKEIATTDILKFPFQDPSYRFGPRSYLFRQFTAPRKDTNGYSTEVGQILSASGDKAFQSIIPKLKDNVYRLSASIFMLTEAYNMTDMLKKEIPIKLFFKPIVKKLLTADSPSMSKWNDVLSGTIFQKFGSASLPNFPSIQDVNAGYYESFNPDFVTFTATNYVTITRMNFMLDDFVVSDPTYVTHLFIFADVLKIGRNASLSLPGSKRIYLICRELVALSSGNSVPEIIVGSHVNSEPVIKIVAKSFSGILKLTQSKSGRHYTYANGLVYKTVKDPRLRGQLTVRVDNSKRLLNPDKQTVAELYDTNGRSHEAKWLHQSLVTSFELAVTSVESILSVRFGQDESVITAGESLEWIKETLTGSAEKSSPLSTDLEMVLGRALLISKTRLSEYAKSRLLVPKLSFPQYKPLYDQLLSTVSQYEATFRTISAEIQRRKQEERTTNSLQELNKNVKSIGSFLLEQAEVNARHQDDISNTHQAVHDLEKDNILKEQGQADQILREIIDIQTDVNAKGKTLADALRRYQKEQIIGAVLGVAEVVGSLFTGVVGLGSIDKKLKGIIRIAEKIKNVVTIIEQVSKLYELGINMRNDIGTINRALESIPNPTIDSDSFPIELEWDDFDTDVRSYTTPGGFLPSQVAGEALDFYRASRRLSVRGRKYVNIAANIAERKYRQIQIEMQRDLAKRQSDRLRTIKTRLKQIEISDKEANRTDLFEIGNIIKMKENQVRSQLVQTFVLMDAALQYAYLQKPTEVSNYDTTAIQMAAVRQIESSISALQNFPSRPVNLPTPVDYPVYNVSVPDLLSKEGYKVTIPLSSLPFREYVRVRVLNIEVRADGIAGSANDTAYIQANASGELFQDRDLDRNPRQYSTMPTEYRYVYNIKTGKTIVNSNPSPDFNDKFIQMTPFDDWVFSLPKKITNKGIRFSTNLTTLRIKFYVNVIFHPPSTEEDDEWFQHRLSDDVLGSKDKLLTDLNGRSLVREWDAIMAVNAERVNELWQNQYDDNTKGGFVKSIVTPRRVTFENRLYKTDARVILDVGAPKVQFERNNQDRATLRIKIKKGVAEFWVTSTRTGELEGHYNETLKTTESTELSGTMNLVRLKGLLTEDSRVVLDLSTAIVGVLQLNSLNEHEQLSVRHEIQVFFNTKLRSRDFELARITYEDILTPSGLVPDRFYLATGGFSSATSGYGTLYIFFKTRSPRTTATEQTKRDFNDPLSIDRQIIPTNFEVALFVNNRIIFDEIIKDDITDKFDFDVHTEPLPGQSIAPSQQSVYLVGDPGASHPLHMVLHFDRYKLRPHFTFTIPGSSLRVKSINKGQKLQVHWVNDNLDVSIPYPYTQSGRLFDHEVVKHQTVTFNTKFVRNFVPSIDQDLTISYNEEQVAGSAGSSISSFTEWWLGSQFKTAKNTITSTVNKFLKGLRFDFRSISAFAITQVLFPNRNAFNLTEVYIPGDMLILGTVTRRPTTDSE